MARKQGIFRIRNNVLKDAHRLQLLGKVHFCRGRGRAGVGNRLPLEVVDDVVQLAVRARAEVVPFRCDAERLPPRRLICGTQKSHQLCDVPTEPNLRDRK